MAQAKALGATSSLTATVSKQPAMSPELAAMMTKFRTLEDPSRKGKTSPLDDPANHHRTQRQQVLILHFYYYHYSYFYYFYLTIIINLLCIITIYLIVINMKILFIIY